MSQHWASYIIKMKTAGQTSTWTIQIWILARYDYFKVRNRDLYPIWKKQLTNQNSVTQWNPYMTNMKCLISLVVNVIQWERISKQIWANWGDITLQFTDRGYHPSQYTHTHRTRLTKHFVPRFWHTLHLQTRGIYQTGTGAWTHSLSSERHVGSKTWSKPLAEYAFNGRGRMEHCLIHFPVLHLWRSVLHGKFSVFCHRDKNFLLPLNNIFDRNLHWLPWQWGS